MLNKNGVTNNLGIVDEEFEQGLIMFRQNHYSEAINHFNAVLNLNQGHILAQEYRSKAQEAVNKGEDVPLTEEGVIEERVVPEGEIEEEVIAEEQAAEEEDKGTVALGITIIVLAVVMFIALIAVIVILVVRRKSSKKPSEVKAEEAITAKETKEETKKAKFCPSCGKEVREDQAFCDNCGAKLK